VSDAAPQTPAVRPSFLRESFLTVLGSGYAPFASGSWGSLVSCLLFAILWFAVPRGTLSKPGHAEWTIGLVMVAAIVLASVLSIRWGAWAIARWGRKDPKPFVLDEFAGQWVALLLLPPVATAGLWAWACVVGGQFFLFRLFDVLKPPPAHQIDRDWPAGWGILCDDLVAGFYALVIGQLVWRGTSLPNWLF
jgi:phosphatidylglycerophosphatase A